jgi:ComF family protein
MQSSHIGESTRGPISKLAAARDVVARLLGAVGRAADALVFPWSCPLCEDMGSNGPFCVVCRQELLAQAARASVLACPRCAHSTGPFGDLRGGCAACRGQSLGFDAALSLGPYEGALQTLCLQLKHAENAWLAPWLSDLLVEARREAITQLPSDAWIVPVPLHWWREFERGYNQSEALACGLARHLGLRVRRPLRRALATHRLAAMGPTERREVMHGAFRVRRHARLSGRTVLLVDDVLTTGATCSAAARALKKAGAARVIAIVIARTERTTL